MCTLDADHPFIAPGPNDLRGCELLLLENFDHSLLIIFHSVPCVPAAVKMLRHVSDILCSGHEYPCQPWLHLQEVWSPLLQLRLIDPVS
jgi:hypothetical protein